MFPICERCADSRRNALETATGGSPQELLFWFNNAVYGERFADKNPTLVTGIDRVDAVAGSFAETRLCRHCKTSSFVEHFIDDRCPRCGKRDQDVKIPLNIIAVVFVGILALVVAAFFYHG